MQPTPSRRLRRALEITLERASSWASDGLLFSQATWLTVAKNFLQQCWSVLTLSSTSVPIIHVWGGLFSIFCYAAVIRNLTGFVWIIATYATACFVMFFLFRLLGSANSLTVVASHLGFSVVPLIVLEPLMSALESPLPGIAYIVKFVAVAWAARSASTSLSSTDTRSKAVLFAYPCILYHIFMLNLRR